MDKYEYRLQHEVCPKCGSTGTKHESNRPNIYTCMSCGDVHIMQQRVSLTYFNRDSKLKLILKA